MKVVEMDGYATRIWNFLEKNFVQFLQKGIMIISRRN